MAASAAAALQAFPVRPIDGELPVLALPATRLDGLAA
ncbi:MAG: hypothetical protein JWQ68_1366 [Cryobacterium sp.]|jgi:hypothetical protein|nr:hypothetical protein [Cryobacterium sp.]